MIEVNHQPYVAGIEDHTVQDEDIIMVYSYQDINNDGVSEQIYLYNLNTNATIISYNRNGTIFESWNLYGKFYFNQPVFDFHDLDEDGILEVYSVTITSGDSVFLNQVEMKARTHDIRKRYVTKLERFENELDAIIDGLGFSDITGDGSKDYLFTISAGFTLQPRAVYAWDIKNDRLLRSPFSGIPVKYNDELITADVNADGISEIFLSTWSTDNYKTSVPFSDTASYSLVLTKNLEYLYQPVLMSGPSSVSCSFPLNRSDSTYILTVSRMVRGDENDSKAVLFDARGNEKETALLRNMNTNSSYHYINEHLIYTVRQNAETVIGTIENDFSFMEHVTIPGMLSVIWSANLDDDPEMELVLHDSRENIMYILQDNLHTYTSYLLPSEYSPVLQISLAGKSDLETRFLVQTRKYRMLISYRENPYYKYRFAYYLLLYGSIYLFLFLLQKVFVFRSNRKKMKENRMISLQLQSIMNQLNPHFTFNAINTVGDSILKDNKHQAYENLTKLSELIRSSMDNAFQADKSLGEEIEFVRQYLELESVRFDGKLNYTFNIDSSADLTMRVPKMLIHLFVENAIKHGIFHKTSHGHIQLDITRKKHKTMIVISDDGIGRKYAAKISGRKSNGLRILDEYLELFRKNFNCEITYTIEDLYDQEKDPGTIVRILINQ